jgi:hypothetical protein
MEIFLQLLFCLLFTFSVHASSRNNVFVGYSEADCIDDLGAEICDSYQLSSMCNTGHFRTLFAGKQEKAQNFAAWIAHQPLSTRFKREAQTFPEWIDHGFLKHKASSI